MTKVVVGPAAKKRVAQLKKYITTLGFKKGKWVFSSRRAKHSKDGRELQIGFLAKKKLASMKNKVVDVTYGQSHRLVAAVHKVVPVSRRTRMVRQLAKSLAYAGRMRYTEGADRSELFHRAVGAYEGAGADCSQFSASHYNWFGVPDMTPYDATGSMLNKGRSVTSLQPGDAVFFGPGTAVHMAIAWKKVSGEWILIEFGEQSAPDQITESAAVAYFRARGQYGVRYRSYF